MSERWAFCDRCNRWFYAQQRVTDELRCPVCEASPSQVQERQPDTTASA